MENHLSCLNLNQTTRYIKKLKVSQMYIKFLNNLRLKLKVNKQFSSSHWPLKLQQLN